MRDSEAWERRMALTMETIGPRAWLDEARQQRCRRIAEEQRCSRLQLSLDRCHEYECSLSQQAARVGNDRRRVQELVWGLEDCGGLRTERCRDCDWSDGKVCAVDRRPLGEWGAK